jgi:hypothetical protein
MILKEFKELIKGCTDDEELVIGVGNSGQTNFEFVGIYSIQKLEITAEDDPSSTYSAIKLIPSHQLEWPLAYDNIEEELKKRLNTIQTILNRHLNKVVASTD